MKRYLILLLIVAAACGAQGREVFNIDRNWRFFSNSEVTSDGAPTVNLPHIWNNDALSGKKDYFRGIGNYLKTIEIPSHWSGKRVFIRFYGANAVTNVIINGKHVGEHRGGYTAFSFEITDFLRFGERNYFWVIVNNAPQLDILPTAGDLNSYGGIFRDVELIVTDPVTVAPVLGTEGIFVHPKKVSREEVEAEAVVKVTGTKDGSAQVHLTVFTDEMDTVAQASARVRLSGRTVSTARLPFRIENPTLWDGVYNPFRYNVGIRLTADDVAASDSVVIRTGFRTCTVDPERGFLLNGRPYPIRGVKAHQDRALVGTALQPYQIEEDFELIRDMGANMVHTAGVPHSPEFYELCDRYGILVWCDLPFMGAAYRTDKAFVNSPLFLKNGKDQLREIIRQQMNRPSVVMWGLFSDLHQRGDDPSDYIRQLNMLAKQEDPSRMTVAGSNNDGSFNFITDLIVWDHFFGWTAGTPSDIRIWQEQLHRDWSNLRSGVSYGAGASIYHQEDSLYRAPYMGNWHPERWQTYLHEQYFDYLKGDSLLWGTFVANMFDYGAAGRSWGEGNGINDLGLVTFDRKYRKDAYYFYKANWNHTTPFVYIAERRWDTRRRTTQQIKVYSNRPEVELIVNGTSLGTKTGTNGTFRWEEVALHEGTNTIEARSGNVTDRIGIDILNSGSRSIVD